MPEISSHMMTASCAEGRQALPFLIAVPSWLAPGTVSENCTLAAREFAGKVQEISLMFLETEACLAYSREELHASWPEGAAPFSFHVHLPLDLPWHLGFEKAWEKCRALLQLCAPLQPRCYVLHPPCASAELLPLLAERFAQAGVAPENVLLENVRENDLTGIWPQIQASGFSCCLDLGHILAYGQEALLELRGLWEAHGHAAPVRARPNHSVASRAAVHAGQGRPDAAAPTPAPPAARILPDCGGLRP